MPRKGENIYKRKDGRWEGRYIRSYDSEHKAKYAYVYGKTYSEVKRKLTEQRGNVQKVQPTKNKSSTYGELLDCWLHSMQLNTKESTQARYTHLIKTHIKPHLGAVQLSQLTTDVIEIFIEQQLTDGRLDNSGGLSPKTVTDILTIIKSTIEYARYKEFPVICNLSKLSIKKKEKEMRVFTPSEQESLIGTLTNDMDHSKFGVLLSLYTGIRVGELCALQWEDFDLAHSKLKIRKTMQRIQDLGNGSVSKTKIVITEPKSQCSIREIPLPLFIVDVAKKFASNPKAYILTGTDQYIEPRTMQNRFKSYVKECNVEPANFHVLRHTFATRCVEVGFEVKSLSEVLGHANVNITLNRCFITGSTGSGKSNTTYRILDEMIEHKIPFLVVEPAKGEYKRYYGKLPGIHVYCTNPRYYSMLHINPFRFNQGIHVLEHLDRLIEIFNACWPLYAAMPAILKESFERAYIKCGWDLENSIYIPNGHSKFPTFNDVLEALPEIINSSSYSSDSKGDYTGALVTRVKSLTNGISGQVLCSVNDIDEEYLFDQNTIVDLSRVSSLETKSLLMGVLILKLNEYRMCTSEENQPLRHVTVMEEAHNILKCSPTGGSEGSNVQAKSVEMISSAIAEMRTYGEGFIIVDQSPTAVDVSAVKNTNTKIIMRLPDYEDCKIAGLSMGLNDSQIREISRFPMGVAVVYQNNWVEAVLTQIDKSEEQYHQTDLITDDYALAVIKGQLAVELVFQYETGLAAEEGFQLDDLLEIINSSDINASKKQDIVQSMVDWCSCFEREAPVNGSFAAKLAEFISCNGLFEALPIRLAKDYKNEPKITRDCIDKKDLASIRNWHSRVYDHLDSYVLLTDENIKNRVLRYLLLNKRVEEINYNKYQLIYEGIYGKARGNK